VVETSAGDFNTPDGKELTQRGGCVPSPIIHNPHPILQCAHPFVGKGRLESTRLPILEKSMHPTASARDADWPQWPQKLAPTPIEVELSWGGRGVSLPLHPER
jgi:hypothetical protein